jgi:glycine/D-amino acid oxidase-like deaminating enzyme
MTTYDAVIVGGGIVGCACAYYLAQDGLRVAVVESGPVGGGTTAAGMGHVVVMDDSEAQFALTRYSQCLWQTLSPELGPRAEEEVCGTLWVAADEEEAAFLPAKRRFYEERGVPAEELDARQVAEAEPHLRPGLAGGLRIPNDSVVYAIGAAQWLLDRVLARGGRLVRGTASRLSPMGVLLQDGSRLDAGVVVNAAGSHAGDLVPGLSIEPRKGHLVITDRYPGMVRHQLVELGYLKSAHGSTGDSVAFNVQPRATGQLLIGSSRQYVGWDDSIDRALVARMLRRACEFVPGLGGLSAIRTWAGFRPATPDKMPLIGPHHGVYIAAGHEGLGVTTSLGTGRLIADFVAGRSPEIDPRPYDPGRGVPA